MTLRQRIEALIDAIGAKFKEMARNTGSADNLQTSEKGSIVGAVNELKVRIDGLSVSAGGAAIDDSASTTDKTYSSQKINELISSSTTSIKSEILGGVDTSFDTLKEIAAYIEQDKTGATSMAEAISKRLRIDESQTLSSAQKSAVEATLNLGDTDADFVAKFEAALK